MDQYYVPFRVNKARTKRKPDAPFMAMFSMYASNRKTAEMGQDEEHRNGHPHEPLLDGVEETEDDDEDLVNITMNRPPALDVHDGSEMLNGHDDAELDMEEKVVHHDLNDDDDDNDHGSSPPLQPMIPSNHIAAASGNPLENLKERYYNSNLPKSLQPTEPEQSTLPAQNGH